MIGFIHVGVLVGPVGFGALNPAGAMALLFHDIRPHSIEPEFGIILLRFSIGLELSFRRLWAIRRLVFGTGMAELTASAALIGVSLHLIGQDPP